MNRRRLLGGTRAAVAVAPEPLPLAEPDGAAVDLNTTCISAAVDRELVRLDGEIGDVRISDRGGARSLEADFVDDTGTITLVWLGRERIVGVRTGVRMHVEGRVGDCSGLRTIFNPRYELLG